MPESGNAAIPWRALVLVLAAVALGAAVRAQLGLKDAGFDAGDPTGMLRSDPAELHYLGRRVVEAGGTPSDFGADPRLAWPETVDVPATFTVGQEYLVLAAHQVLPSLPLHVLAQIVGALTSAFVALGVFGIVFELTRSARLGLLATATYCVLPAAYRTVGFVWIREDLSLPLLVCGAWALARAARTRTVGAAVVTGLLLGASSATWHGAGIGVALLGAATLAAALFARTRSPEAIRAWPAGLLAFAAVTLLVPALRAKGALLSLAPSLFVAAFASEALVRSGRRRAAFAASLGVVALCALLRGALHGDDLDHVRELLVAKLAYLGEKPVDPERLSADVRIMWQGPFEGTRLTRLFALCGLPLVFALPGALVVLARRIAGRDSAPSIQLAAAVATLLALALTLLAERGMAFAAPAVAVSFALAARAMQQLGSAPVARGAVLSALLLQALVFAGWVSRFEVAWNRPLPALEARARTVAAVREHVPEGEPVLATFLTGPALLADHLRPIVLQPKWETRAARERVHRFLAVTYREDLDGFRRYLRDEARCRWVLVEPDDWFGLGAMRYAAGFPADLREPPTGSALAALIAPDAPAGFSVEWEGPRGVRLLHLRE